MSELQGLPANVDAERFVLGSILLDYAKLSDAAGLHADDFSLQRHQQIFAAMLTLDACETHADTVTVAEELARRGMLGNDGLSYLTSLDNGIPNVPHIQSYVKIVMDKATLRRGAFMGQKLLNECLLETATPAEILAGHAGDVEVLRMRAAVNGDTIKSVADLTSVFADPQPVRYLVDPELSEGSLVTYTGDSESGKSTLLCAHARDVNAAGHAVLYLDRDKNPRHTIRERLERLGVTTDGPLLRIWDYQQSQEAPQPNDPRVVAWVTEQIATTGLAPLVIVDSLISFLLPGESENDNAVIRSLINRCRALTRLGACVALLHHTGKSETSKNGRGGSDFRPASDQAFLVRNFNPDGSRLLHTLTLTCTKSRDGITEEIVYHYGGGRMVKDLDRHAVSKTVSEHLTALLRANPGTGKREFEQLAVDARLGRNNASRFLDLGIQAKEIRFVENVRGRGGRYYLASDAPEDPQDEFASEAPDEN